MVREAMRKIDPARGLKPADTQPAAGEAAAERTAPALTVFPKTEVRAAQVAVVVAYTPIQSIDDAMKGARDGMLRVMGAVTAISELAIGPAEADHMEAIVGPAAPGQAWLVGYVAAAGAVRARWSTAACVAAELGAGARLHVLKIGAGHASGHHSAVCGLLDYISAGSRVLRNVTVKRVKGPALDDMKPFDADLLRCDREFFEPNLNTPEDAMRQCLEFMEMHHKGYMVKGRQGLIERWTRMWKEVREPVQPAEQDDEATWKAFTPYGYQRAATEELKRPPCSRRIIYLMGLGDGKRIGKTQAAKQWRQPRWWVEEEHTAYPGLLKITSVVNMHHFVPSYSGQRILLVHFERGA
jgi:hypothetical protein